MTATRAGFWQRHRVLGWVGGLSVLAFAALTGVVLTLAHRAEPLLRARIVQGLSEHFHARVELDSFHVSLREGLWAEGKGLRIWPPNRMDGGAAPDPRAAAGPLIQLAEFRFHAPLHYKPGQAIRVSQVQLKGLDIDVPPRPPAGADGQKAKAFASQPQKPAEVGSKLLNFRVEKVECEGAHLTIETSKPGKLPLGFAIAHLKLTAGGANGIGNGAMDFEAELTNPRPVGTIHTKGSFGPWVIDDPGETPVSGDYVFEHADLGGFKGIAGIMSSTGHYAGSLRDMVVDGKTETPDFRLTRFGTPMALSTTFHARVDGTNGDTWLDPVEATLGHSHFFARGEIVRVAPAAKGESGPRFGGHHIALKINVDRGRIEDFLRLASRSGAPILNGALTTKASLDIQPGPVPVDERLKLKGSFALDDAQFLDEKIQGRIAQLSARGQGHPKDAKNPDPATDVRSTMSGDFQMSNKVVTLSALEYTVPGAVIDLSGSYNEDGGELDFSGTARMEAKISEMVGGWKGLLLKPVDRYFQKNGSGAEVPIHITGTRESPKFGIDFNRMKGASAQRPDQPE